VAGKETKGCVTKGKGEASAVAPPALPAPAGVCNGHVEGIFCRRSPDPAVKDGCTFRGSYGVQVSCAGRALFAAWALLVC
jgi:hypothetical protein